MSERDDVEMTGNIEELEQTIESGKEAEAYTVRHKTQSGTEFVFQGQDVVSHRPLTLEEIEDLECQAAKEAADAGDFC